LIWWTMSIKMYVRPPKLGGFYTFFKVDGKKVISESNVPLPDKLPTAKKSASIKTYAPNLWPMPVPGVTGYENGIMKCSFNVKNIGLKDALSPKITVDETSCGVILKDYKKMGEPAIICEELTAGDSSSVELDFDVPSGVTSFKVVYHFNCTDERGYDYSFGDVNRVRIFVEDRGDTTRPWIYRIDEDKYVNISGEVEWADLPTISPDGNLVAYDSRSDGAPDIWVMKTDGTGKKKLTDTGNNRYASWSPDGTKIAFQSWRDGKHQIFMMNPDGSDVEKLSNGKFADGCPTFSPDGGRIAFSRNEEGDILDYHSHVPQNLWMMNADGKEEKQITSNKGNNCFLNWSPDGSMLAFRRSRVDFEHGIFVINSDGTGEKDLSMDAGAIDMDPFWSPGGTHIAFSSKRGAEGWDELYVMRNDGKNKRRVIYAPGAKGKVAPLNHEAMIKPLPGGIGGDFYHSWYRK